MLSHGKSDLSYFFFHGGAENCVDLLHISVAEIAEANNLPRVLEKYVLFICKHIYLCKQLLPQTDDGRSISRNVANINLLVQDKTKLFFQNILQPVSIYFLIRNV